ncbi:hypothetical protein CTZ28_42675 [Streptomyces shenzhenensis]|uniref:Uncharacterized protein n=1 Tax=Streptomyces shenzhenensis TaxID=943815 RepID=A0A3M0HTR5_9ACTN|nr:hypothetical protein CTZ28_42675 [Streptomyces shenzhenensis]
MRPASPPLAFAEPTRTFLTFMTVNMAFSKLLAVLHFLIPECAAVTETEQTPVVILVTPV